MNTFAQDIKDFTELDIEKVEQIINDKGTAIVFIGRSTCPYCRMFAPKLAKVATEIGLQVHFVNSEKPGQEAQLASFRSTYAIPTVPGLVQIHQGEVSVRCDSSMSEADIKAFIQA